MHDSKPGTEELPLLWTGHAKILLGGIRMLLTGKSIVVLQGGKKFTEIVLVDHDPKGGSNLQRPMSSKGTNVASTGSRMPSIQAGLESAKWPDACFQTGP